MQKMNTCLAILAIAQLTEGRSVGDMKHPVREELVNSIKLKQTSWKPKEVNENHFRHRSPESIKRSMGHLGMSPAPFGSQFFKSVTDSAMDFFKSMTSTLREKEEVHKLKQSELRSDFTSKTDKNKKEEEELPKEFSWRKERPECLGPI